MWKLFALPLALLTAGLLAFIFSGCSLRGLDRVGCGTELVRGDMRDHRGLTGSIRGMACRSSQISGSPHRMAARRASLGHLDLAACPCAGLLNCVTRTIIFGLHFLKAMQNMLRAGGCPECKQM